MTSKHQVAEAGKIGWADARKPIVKTAWAALLLNPSYKAKRNSNAANVGWISVSASTGLTVWQGLVDALSLIHPTDELILVAA